MNLRNVTLEFTAKPFYDDREQTMLDVGRKIFLQWKNLTDAADEISVLLWIADGSEILNWSGTLDQTFEWAYWEGCAEACPPPSPNELYKRLQHNYPRKYRDDAAPRTYRWLKQLIAALRTCCMEVNGKPLKVIATFDNGPEFCLSDFKYRIHPEICGGSTLGEKRSVICNSILKGDHRTYAAYPNGIPDGLSLGRFFGEQFRLYAKEFGYDAIWLSNGMGFGRDPWGITGFLFDGTQFHPNDAESARHSMLQFWKDFTSACPDMEIQTRGSNQSAGVELASDAAPLAELYGQYKIVPPVNSPWAALNFNTGLEIAAWMSHIAELPGKSFPYRFYPHDPWFRNSPWLDRYGREPWDIYLPLAVGRFDENGIVRSPDSIALLTIDNSFGELPDCVPQEITPHLLDAFASDPDTPPPFVWVYPFRHYCEMVHGSQPHPEIVFNEDMFLGEIIQGGFPLNTVISLDYLDKLPATMIAFMPVSAFGTNAEQFLSRGGRIIFYGSLQQAPDSLKTLLGLRTGDGLTGPQNVTLHRKNDSFRNGDYAMEIVLHDVFDGGPLTERADGAQIIAEAGGRVLASVHGNAAFLRSILPIGRDARLKWHELVKATPDVAFPMESLARTLVASFGWNLEYSAIHSNAMLPRMSLSRHQNMFFFNVFARDTTAHIAIRTPLGVPVLDEMETEYTNSRAIWHPTKCWRHRCRIFVDQTEDAVFSQKIETTEDFALAEHFSINGLQDATVRIFLPEECLSRLELVTGLDSTILTPCIPYEIENSEFGACAVARHVSGYLSIGVVKAAYAAMKRPHAVRP